MKKIAKIIGIIAGVLCVIIVGFIIILHIRTTTATKDINVQTTDATAVLDGTYAFPGNLKWQRLLCIAEQM